MGEKKRGILSTVADMARGSLLVLAVAAVLAVMAVTGAAGLSVEIRANAEECFYERMASQAKMGLSFQVTDGGNRDVDVSIVDPEDKVVHSENRASEGKYTFVAHQDGIYKFCFSNKISTVTAKVVSFSITGGVSKGLPGGADTDGDGTPVSQDDLAKKEHLTPMEQSLRELNEGLRAIQDEQRYMRNREVKFFVCRCAYAGHR